MIKSRIFVLSFLLLMKIVVFAGEGMWIPLFLKSLNEKEMRGMGMKMSAEDIYSTNHSSLKDAIVHFGGFCTAEVISPNGLMLTNHHCGYREIQSHSTVENNILKNGFWAANYGEEKPCQGLNATFIVRIEDVTDQILAGVLDGMTAEERQEVISINSTAILSQFERINFRELQIKPFFEGNQYFAIETVLFPDVRLVGNPPESIGKFGSDTDNWVWPRHTGDFSFFRIYANKNNEPANYSEDNIPYTPKHFLPVSLDGVEEGDFTLVFGFPGSTQEYIPSTAVDNIVNVYNPAKIEMRDAALKVMDKAMRQDEAVRLQYAPKYARIANYWKKWIGESTGIQKTHGLARKKEYEAQFEKKVRRKRKFKKKYKTVLMDVSEAHKDIAPYQLAYDVSGEMLYRNVEIFRQMRQFEMLKNSLELYGLEEFNTAKEKLEGVLDRFYTSYRPDIDRDVLGGQLDIYAKYMPRSLMYKGVLEGLEKYGSGKNFAKYLFDHSKLVNEDSVKKVFQMAPEQFILDLINDPLFVFHVGLSQQFMTDISTPYKEKVSEIDHLQQKYMKAQMEVMGKKKRFYPDANSTLRVTYGKVEGYSTEEAGTYAPMTYLDGVIEKYKPGDYEFDVPDKLLQLYKTRDYGAYGTTDGKMPVCFIGSNHTSGGNSGSPAIDAYGNLIGLNFDRVWEGTMSDINYDRSICRNIMVDVRYILFIVDKYANAGHLVREMNLVHPKQQDK